MTIIHVCGYPFLQLTSQDIPHLHKLDFDNITFNFYLLELNYLPNNQLSKVKTKIK
jgi:hypothetical protein